MLTALRRHPFAIEAFFRHSLVLTYAYPEALLSPLLPPGVSLDTHEGHGFVAIALVQTEALRPAGLPRFLGRDFFLAGYRIFGRHRDSDGRLLRGLVILRSDADSRAMVWGGRLWTHYRYGHCAVASERTHDAWALRVTTPHARADLVVRALVGTPAPAPPDGSPFADLRAARRFAGPLPFTFAYEAASHQLVVVEGVRENWRPTPVRVEVDRCTFLEAPPFDRAVPRLANAFFVERVPYRWKRGRLSAVSADAP